MGKVTANMFTGNVFTEAGTWNGDLRPFEAIWCSEAGAACVQVRVSNNVREVRDGLLCLMYGLHDLVSGSPSAPPYKGADVGRIGLHGILVVNTRRISPLRMVEELERFRRVVAPEWARRLRLVMREPNGRLTELSWAMLPVSGSLVDLRGLEAFLREQGGSPVEAASEPSEDAAS